MEISSWLACHSRIASIGIVKGRPFAPDERMEGILREAVAVGNATARAIVFDARNEDTYIYPKSAWITGFVGGSFEWLIEGGLEGFLVSGGL